jgi:hypothetical protein
MNVPYWALEVFRQKKQAHTKTFGIPGTEGHVALTDLAKFCSAFGPELFEDRDMGLVMTGRRQAFWRVYAHLNLEPHELAVIYKSTVLATGDE